MQHISEALTASQRCSHRGMNLARSHSHSQEMESIIWEFLPWVRAYLQEARDQLQTSPRGQAIEGYNVWRPALEKVSTAETGTRCARCITTASTLLPELAKLLSERVEKVICNTLSEASSSTRCNRRETRQRTKPGPSTLVLCWTKSGRRGFSEGHFLY